nr:hypothetical protein CFP56_60885 [Quercus suber]
MQIPLSQLVAELEALACRRVVQFALEIGLRRMTFEGDLVTVVNAIVRRSPEFLPYENVIDDIRFQTSDILLGERYLATSIFAEEPPVHKLTSNKA